MGKLIPHRTCFGVHRDLRRRPACSALPLINDANNGSMVNPSAVSLGSGVHTPRRPTLTASRMGVGGWARQSWGVSGRVGGWARQSLGSEWVGEAVLGNGAVPL